MIRRWSVVRLGCWPERAKRPPRRPETRRDSGRAFIPYGVNFGSIPGARRRKPSPSLRDGFCAGQAHTRMMIFRLDGDLIGAGRTANGAAIMRSMRNRIRVLRRLTPGRMRELVPGRDGRWLLSRAQ